MKRFLIISIIVLIALLTLTVNCFASYDFPSVDGLEFEHAYYGYFISEVYTYDSVLNKTARYTRLHVYSSDDKNTIDNVVLNHFTEQEGIDAISITSPNGPVRTSVYILYDTGWKYNQGMDLSANTTATFVRNDIETLGSEIIMYESSTDIRENGSTSNLFFPAAPVTVLAPILEEVEMNQPITTTIVGLAKLLIPLLICLIGFWKAWRLLSRMLHKS